MADTYGLQGDPYDLAPTFEAAAAGANGLAKEFAKLMDVEARRLQLAQRQEQQSRALEAIERQSQALNDRKAKTESRGKDQGELNPTVRGLAAFGGAVSTVATALAGVAGAAKSAYDTLLNLGRAASPALTKTFDEATGYLMSTLGVTMAPLLLTVGAAAIALADQFQESAFKIAEGTANFLGEVVESTKMAANTIGGWFGRRNENGEVLTEGGREVERGTSPFQEAMGKLLRSFEINQGQAQPRFEQVTEAYRRVQMAESGMTDIQRDQLDMQRKLLQWAQERFGTGPQVTDAGSAGAGDWGGG